MATYLVTGGAGFIGSHLVETLLAEGHRVRVLDDCSTGTRANIPPGAEYIAGDICDPEAARAACQGVDGVFHIAAIPNVQRSVEHPEETAAVNVGGTQNILAAAIAAGVRRVVLASSAAVYGDQATLPFREEMAPNPQSPYAHQKLATEEFGRAASAAGRIETVCLRYANVYGPRQSDTGAYANLFPVFLRQRRHGMPLTITGDGEQTRDFTHVRDVVHATILAMQSVRVGRGEIINVGSGRATSVNEIARQFGGPTVHVPPRVEQRHARLDIQRARELLGWEPSMQLGDGIRGLIG